MCNLDGNRTDRNSGAEKGYLVEIKKVKKCNKENNGNWNNVYWGRGFCMKCWMFGTEAKSDMKKFYILHTRCDGVSKIAQNESALTKNCNWVETDSVIREVSAMIEKIEEMLNVIG